MASRCVHARSQLKQEGDSAAAVEQHSQSELPPPQHVQPPLEQPYIERDPEKIRELECEMMMRILRVLVRSFPSNANLFPLYFQLASVALLWNACRSTDAFSAGQNPLQALFYLVCFKLIFPLRLS